MSVADIGMTVTVHCYMVSKIHYYCSPVDDAIKRDLVPYTTRTYNYCRITRLSPPSYTVHC